MLPCLTVSGGQAPGISVSFMQVYTARAHAPDSAKTRISWTVSLMLQGRRTAQALHYSFKRLGRSSLGGGGGSSLPAALNPRLNS